MKAFEFQKLFQTGADKTEYRFLGKEGVDVQLIGDKEILKISDDVLEHLSKVAFKDVAHLYRASHLEGWKNILEDPEASSNDIYVAQTLLENAVIASAGTLPGCQDTGTAIVVAHKGQYVWTEGDDKAALSNGIAHTYTESNLRYSQVAPISMFEEKNTGTNLPAQIDIYAGGGNAYEFLFVAKGGGSANKTFLYQKTKALLNPKSMMAFLRKELPKIGTSACPPYHLAIVIGGTSAEMNLKTVKLTSTKYYDELPVTGNEYGRAFRDKEMEEEILHLTRNLGIGAQFGGKYFCMDVRVVRLSRHGASCPVGIGVSCSADRNIKAKITRDGVFLEKLVTDPAQYLSVKTKNLYMEKPVHIDLNKGMDELCHTLSQYPVKTRLLLNGDIIVARDIAHARINEQFISTGKLPEYLKNHIVYYAGPAKTPEGYASGSFGPTTASRMDPYIPVFQKERASLVTLAKGNRSSVVTESCKKNGGFYLGSIGGAAAILAKNSITNVELIEFEELGMEAVYRITVKDFPAFIVVDDKGNDFYEQVSK